MMGYKITAIAFVFMFRSCSFGKGIRCFQSRSNAKHIQESCESSHGCYVRAFVGLQSPTLLPLVLKSLRFGCAEEVSTRGQCGDSSRPKSKSPYQMICCSEGDFCNLPTALRDIIHKSQPNSHVKRVVVDRGTPAMQLASVIMPSISIAIVVLATLLILYKVYQHQKTLKLIKYQVKPRFKLPAKSRSVVVRTMALHNCKSAIGLFSGPAAAYKSNAGQMLEQLQKHYNHCEYERNLNTQNVKVLTETKDNGGRVL